MFSFDVSQVRVGTPWRFCVIDEKMDCFKILISICVALNKSTFSCIKSKAGHGKSLNNTKIKI